MQPTALLNSRAPRLMPDVRRTEHEKTFRSFHRGCRRFSAFTAAPCCFPRSGWSRGWVGSGVFDLRRGHEDPEHRAAATVRGIRFRSASGREVTGDLEQRRGVTACWRSLGPASVRRTGRHERHRSSDRHAGLHRFRSVRSVVGAPLWGLFATPSHSRAFRLARAQSKDRLTSHWSRRAGQSGAILSPRRAAQCGRWADSLHSRR